MGVREFQKENLSRRGAGEFTKKHLIQAKQANKLKNCRDGRQGCGVRGQRIQQKQYITSYKYLNKQCKVQKQNLRGRKMNSQIAERIKNRIQQHGNAIDIDQLCLDSIEIINFTTTTSRQIENCFNVMFLTLNHCDLVSLKFFPNLPSLIALEIIGNHLQGIDIQYITNCQNIQELALDQNRIEHIEDLAPLNNLVDLEHLEVRGNPLCLIDNYRAKIFDLIPKLKIVDCQDVFGDEDVMYGTETESEKSNEDQNSQEEQKNDEEEEVDEEEDFGNNLGHKYGNS